MINISQLHQLAQSNSRSGLSFHVSAPTRIRATLEQPVCKTESINYTCNKWSRWNCRWTNEKTDPSLTSPSLRPSAAAVEEQQNWILPNSRLRRWKEVINWKIKCVCACVSVPVTRLTDKASCCFAAWNWWSEKWVLETFLIFHPCFFHLGLFRKLSRRPRYPHQPVRRDASSSLSLRSLLIPISAIIMAAPRFWPRLGSRQRPAPVSVA